MTPDLISSALDGDEVTTPNGPDVATPDVVEVTAPDVVEVTAPDVIEVTAPHVAEVTTTTTTTTVHDPCHGNGVEMGDGTCTCYTNYDPATNCADCLGKYNSICDYHM